MGSQLPADEHVCLRIGARGLPSVFLRKFCSLNFSQFVEGRRWRPWAREDLEEVRVFAGDGL